MNPIIEHVSHSTPSQPKWPEFELALPRCGLVSLQFMQKFDSLRPCQQKNVLPLEVIHVVHPSVSERRLHASPLFVGSNFVTGPGLGF